MFGRLAAPVTAAAWHDVPATCLLCADDRGAPAVAQFARRADKVIEIAAGHHPILSPPDAVADIIAALV